MMRLLRERQRAGEDISKDIVYPEVRGNFDRVSGPSCEKYETPIAKFPKECPVCKATYKSSDRTGVGDGPKKSWTKIVKGPQRIPGQNDWWDYSPSRVSYPCGGEYVVQERAEDIVYGWSTYKAPVWRGKCGAFDA